jgi:hypothetical protein
VISPLNTKVKQEEEQEKTKTICGYATRQYVYCYNGEIENFIALRVPLVLLGKIVWRARHSFGN